MKLIEFKTINPFFDDLWNGRKPPIEIRKDDRPEKVEIGDILWLREYKPAENPFQLGREYSGRDLIVEVTYILPPFEGIAPGYKLYGIRELTRRNK
jgi:hypothetical protein